MPKNPRFVPRTGYHPATEAAWGEAWRAASDLLRDAVDFRGRLCLACGTPLTPTPFTDMGRSPSRYCSQNCKDRARTRRHRLRKHLERFGADCPMCGCKRFR